jgi:alpha-L-fucosidase 2
MNDVLAWLKIIVIILFFEGNVGHAQTVNMSDITSITSLDDYNVAWDSPSKNALGSMPAGNGDIGINLWVEENGDLLFYLSKTDAWSENARLLKLGKVRLSLSPNPFRVGLPFLQKLVLKDGMIHIEAGNLGERVLIDVWVDANHPVVELDVKSQKKISASVTTEPWRLEQREIADNVEIHSAYGLKSIRVEKDIVLAEDRDNVLWVHRNERSIWEDNLKMQGLKDYIAVGKDPLLHATFGALIHSKQLRKSSAVTLVTAGSLRAFSISVFALNAQTESLNTWQQDISNLAKRVTAHYREDRKDAHAAWWQAFWHRSYIYVSARKKEEKEMVATVSKNYALQRYMNACSGRGNSPIKFNGSIFTVDTYHLDNRYGGFDADYRQWGGPYWWQNTRLPYWSMLEAGDFDLMRPLFKMYHELLDIRKFTTKTYYDHEGAFYLETMRHWGTFAEANYGPDRPEDMPLGTPVNTFIRYYWQSGLEFSLMALDYYAFTNDEKTLNELILPVITEVMTFFDQHWGRDEQGKILFDPAMALETYQTAINPLPEIVGIRKVCMELLMLPNSLITEGQRNQYNRIITELPELPMREVNGEILLAPAQAYSGKQNIENPELYAIFPYRRFGVGKDSLELAIRTFNAREARENRGWQQHSIKAAYLGLAEEAAALMAENFNAGTTVYRFPTMWGPNYDWTPDQCHGSVAMIALQRMLVQYEGNDIYLLPAWPEDWDVTFKLRAPQNTTIEGKVENGKITKLLVSPERRRNDLVIRPNN